MAPDGYLVNVAMEAADCPSAPILANYQWAWARRNHFLPSSAIRH
jgi:hypothetical protein